MMAADGGEYMTALHKPGFFYSGSHWGDKS